MEQPGKYRAFIPALLPPDPPVHMDPELFRALSDADRALGRLDAMTTLLPNPDLFVAMYVKHEAVLSSQIEGSQSTLGDILEYESDSRGQAYPEDITEVVNYVQAMNHGLGRLKELPLCLRLIREIHAELLKDVRGSHRTPGEFRRTQNWIGPEGCAIVDAQFVPPPPHEMHMALDNLEHFLRDSASLPVLIHCGLAHAQFETIHPFLDGNGRIGRLLITLLLCESNVLQRPLLYLSHYLKSHRAHYYDRLMAVRSDGDWEGWLRFFLRGVYEVSCAAVDTAREIIALRESHRTIVSQCAPTSTTGPRLLEYLFQHPLVSIRKAEQLLGCSYVTASNLIRELQRLGILREITGKKRNRLFRYEPYVALFDRQVM